MSFTNLQPSSVNTSATFTFANVVVSNIATLGAVGNVKITGGSSGQAIITDGTGNLSFTSVTTSPPGSNTQVAYNNAGSYGASANFAFNNTSNTLTVDKIVANGAGITYITGSNVTGQVANALVSGTVLTAAQPNITSVGTLTNVTIAGPNSISGGNLLSANYVAGTLTTAAQPNITSHGTLTGLTVSGVTNLGAVTNVKITGGLTNQVLTTDGLGNLTWTAGGGGSGSSGGAGFITVTKDVFTATGSANAYTLSITPASAAYVVVNIDGIVQQLSSYSLSTNVLTIAGMPAAGEVIEITSYGVGGLPGGSDTQVQYNSSGVFQGAPAFTFNSSTSTLSVTNIAGNLTTGAQPNITSLGTLATTTIAANANIAMSGSLSKISGGNLVSASYLTGTLTTAAQPNITSLGSLSAVTVAGTSTLQQSTEVILAPTFADPLTVDFTAGTTTYVTPTANFTFNVTNVPTTNNRSIVVVLILVQGSTPYSPTAFQIDGTAQTVNWASGVSPVPKANKKDIASFTLIRTGSAWTVFGQYGSFG